MYQRCSTKNATGKNAPRKNGKLIEKLPLENPFPWKIATYPENCPRKITPMKFQLHFFLSLFLFSWKQSSVSKIYFHSIYFQTPGGSWRGPMKQGLGTGRPSVRPSVFLELYHQFFLNFAMVLETHMKLCVTQPDFFRKKFFTPKIGKMENFCS